MCFALIQFLRYSRRYKDELERKYPHIVEQRKKDPTASLTFAVFPTLNNYSDEANLDDKELIQLRKKARFYIYSFCAFIFLIATIEIIILYVHH
jgi:hypothetical protein